MCRCLEKVFFSALFTLNKPGIHSSKVKSSQEHWVLLLSFICRSTHAVETSRTSALKHLFWWKKSKQWKVWICEAVWRVVAIPFFSPALQSGTRNLTEKGPSLMYGSSDTHEQQRFYHANMVHVWMGLNVYTWQALAHCLIIFWFLFLLYIPQLHLDMHAPCWQVNEILSSVKCKQSLPSWIWKL